MSEKRQLANKAYRQKGAAYLLAVTTLLVGVVLALAMLRATSGNFYAENSRHAERAAANLAEAGLDYAYWQIQYNGAHLPYSATVSLATGSFQVSAVDDGARDPSTIVITSTGMVGRDKYQCRRVMLGLLPYHYARCEYNSINEADTITSSGQGRGIRTNGSVWLGNSQNNILTGVWAANGTNLWGTVSPTYPNTPPIRFPDIDPSYYSSIANYTHSSDATYTSLNFPGQRVVIFVGRDLTVRGTYNGLITLFAVRDVSVSGPLVAANNSSCVAIIAQRNITFEAPATTVEGIFYCHNPSLNGRIEVKGITTIRGSACADTIVTDRSTVFNPMLRINLDVMKQLRLPGLY